MCRYTLYLEISRLTKEVEQANFSHIIFHLHGFIRFLFIFTDFFCYIFSLILSIYLLLCWIQNFNIAKMNFYDKIIVLSLKQS